MTAYSPAWLDEPNPEHDPDDNPTTAAVRLRHGPARRRHAFFKVTPIDEPALAVAGRLDRLALAPRLGARPAPLRTPAQSLVPEGRVAHVEMLVPDGAHAGLPTQVWAVDAGREQAFSSPGGTAKLIYAAGADATKGAVAVVVDGRVALRAPLYATRGELTFGVPPGEHRLRIEAPPGTSLFFSGPLRGAPMFRRVAVHQMPTDDGKRLRIRLHKTHVSYVLGAVFYGRDAAGADPQLEVVVDGGRREVGAFVSRDRTPLRRALPLRAEAMTSCLLLNTNVAPGWQSRPVFFTLGDDLPPGAHNERAGRDASEHVRMSICESLGTLRASLPLRRFIDASSEASPRVRASAAIALAKTAPLELEIVLRADPDELPRRVALEEAESLVPEHPALRVAIADLAARAPSGLRVLAADACERLHHRLDPTAATTLAGLAERVATLGRARLVSSR